MQNESCMDPLGIKYDQLSYLKDTHKHTYILQNLQDKFLIQIQLQLSQLSMFCCIVISWLSLFSHFLHCLIRLLHYHHAAKMTLWISWKFVQLICFRHYFMWSLAAFACLQHLLWNGFFLWFWAFLIFFWFLLRPLGLKVHLYYTLLFLCSLPLWSYK